MRHKYMRILHAVLLLILTLLCCSCGKHGQTDTRPGTSEKAASSGSVRPYTPGQTHVLLPESAGTDTCGCDFFTLDFSNANQGYFTGRLTEAGKKVNIQVTGPDNVIYNYFLETPDTSAVFPFTAGNGNYIVLAFEHVGSDQYVSLFSHSLAVELENEFLPYLYPNQYVSFSDDSQAVKLAAELTADAETDLAALEVIYQYVTEHITYDNNKAATVQTGYLPDIDDTLQTGTGICFDYAALTAAMLRSLSIPARLEIGYSSDVRHAWIDVYIESMGWVENAVEFNGKEWKLMDPTFASAAGGSDAIHTYIGNGDNYSLQYVR